MKLSDAAVSERRCSREVVNEDELIRGGRRLSALESGRDMRPADSGKDAEYRDGDYSLDQREARSLRRHPTARLACVIRYQGSLP
jgi:hypothetical protein